MTQGGIGNSSQTSPNSNESPSSGDLELDSDSDWSMLPQRQAQRGSQLRQRPFLRDQPAPRQAVTKPEARDVSSPSDRTNRNSANSGRTIRTCREPSPMPSRVDPWFLQGECPAYHDRLQAGISHFNRFDCPEHTTKRSGEVKHLFTRDCEDDTHPPRFVQHTGPNCNCPELLLSVSLVVDGGRASPRSSHSSAIGG
jgi:hypothetical protein